ncbi:protein mono-ADP-ribosyltransferase PARP12-like [Lissotriton helveticus]
MFDLDTEPPPTEDGSMSDPAFTGSLTKQLCMHGGRLLIADIPSLVGLTPEHIAGILHKEEKRFPEPELGTVMIQSPVRLCTGYLGNKCQATDCGRLHLCRYFILGHCFIRGNRHGKFCRFSHNIHSEGNKAVLKANDISNLNEKELRVLLQLNDPSCLPEVCHDYKGVKSDTSCPKGEECRRLHVCQYFARGQCRYFNCNRSHNLLDPIAIEVMKGRRLSMEMINNIQILRIHQCNEARKEPQKYENPRRTKVFQPLVRPVVSPEDCGDPNEICSYHIWAFCQRKSECLRMHYHLPYRWQIEKVPGVWEDLPWMEDIEKAYSDPNNTSSGRHDINFEIMISSYHQVRRLSTASSVTQPPDHPMTTEWVWHWKNEHGTWIEYGQHGGKEKATIASADLETTYLADKKAVVPFQAGSQQYQINFKDMIQENLMYKTEKEVRRRPRFMSKEDIDKLKASTRSKVTANQAASSTKGIPGSWDSTAVPDVGYKLVEVRKHSMEFKEIEKSFKKTMPQHTISKVQRIQNITLWNFYQMQKDAMKKQNKTEVLEKQLFHGTKSIYLDGICRNNFDWRICGLNGTVYGKGSYFARDASYSDGYCDSNSSSKSMFLARVLVGDFTRGSNHYTRPPPRPYSQNTFYDSCVDQDHDPSIFVIFEKHQIYPEYKIEYSKNYQSYPENFTQTFQTVQNSQPQQSYQTQQNYRTHQNFQTQQNSRTQQIYQTQQNSRTQWNYQTQQTSQTQRNYQTQQTSQTHQDASCCIL